MRMRWQLGILCLVALAALAGTACFDTYVGGDVTNQTNTGPSSPTASPSPASGSCPVAGVIASLRVNPFGYQCQAGTPVPNNSSGVLPMGCTAVVTATPKDAAGRDVPDNVHGNGITWSLESGASFVTVTDWPGNEFNKNVAAVSGPGEFRLSASICGVTGAWNGRVIP